MIAFVPKAPKIEEEDGLFLITIASGSETIPVALTPHAMQHFAHRMKRSLDAFHARQNGTVLPMRGTATG